MSLIKWAEKEVEIAKKKERGEASENEWDYGCACYDSALKAFKSLCDDDHSGMSISITKQILDSLIDGRPLTPIEDTDDGWNRCVRQFCNPQVYQCDRMSSLFKRIYDDGRVIYDDVDRITCIDINTGLTYRWNFVTRVIDEMYPITLPYAGETINVFCEDFSVHDAIGDFNAIGIHYAEKDGETVCIHRYFKEYEGGWEEIDAKEWGKCKEMKQ